MFKLFALLIAAILWGVWGVLRLRESEGEQIRQFLEKFSRLGVVNKIAILLVVGPFSPEASMGRPMIPIRDLDR